MQIYKIINISNNKIYVGQDSKNRKDYFGSGLLIKKAIKKYGIENFKKEILEECNKTIANERETFWIRELKSYDRSVGYNISNGAFGGDTITNNENKEAILEKKRKSMSGKMHTIKTKRKIRKSQLEYYKNNPERQVGKNNGNFGKKHPGLNKGHVVSEETKLKISIKAKNRKRKPHSEETKLKIKLSNIGKHKMSEKGKEAIRESNRKRRKIKNNM